MKWKKGLRVAGTVVVGGGLATLMYLGVVNTVHADTLPPPYSDMNGKRLSSVECLAVNNYFESRGESDIANMLVMSVVMNRVEDRRFDNSVCKVVFHPHSFSWTGDGLSDKITDLKTYNRLFLLAEDFLVNKEYWLTLSEGSNHYHATRITPYWANSASMKHTITVDNHSFYRWK